MADDTDLGGPYARDTHKGGFGDDYARDSDPTDQGRSGEVPADVSAADDEVKIGKASE